MKILKAEPDWCLGYDNTPGVKLLINEFPPAEEMLFEKRSNAVYAESGGYVNFNMLSNDHGGIWWTKIHIPYERRLNP